MSPVGQSTMERLIRRGGSPIGEDRPCAKCGYNLKGLVTGGQCPECGAPIRSAFLGKERALGASPRGWLAMLRLGLLLVAIGSLSFSILPGLVSWPSWTSYALLAGGFSAAWALGVVIVARPRPMGTRSSAGWTPMSDWWQARLAAWIAAAAAPVQTGLFCHYLATDSRVSLAAWYLVSAGMAFSFNTYLALIAFWMPDDGKAWGLRGASTLVLVTSLLLAARAVGVFGVAMLVQLVLVAVWLVYYGAMLYAAWAAFRLNAGVKWAIRHARGAEAVEQRKLERAEEQRRKGDEERARAQAVTAERVAMLDRLEQRNQEMAEEEADAPPEVRSGSAKDRVIPRADEIYGLEDDE